MRVRSRLIVSGFAPPFAVTRTSSCARGAALPAYSTRTVPGLTAPLGMNDREDLAWRRQPSAGRRASQRVEEVERHEVQIFVQRLERRDQLFVDADAKVGLAHPDFDVEVAVERLLVRQRLIVGDAHHVVVDARQHLRLVVVPETLRVGANPHVDRRLSVDFAPQPASRHVDARPAGKLVQVLTFGELRTERPGSTTRPPASSASTV